MHPCTQFITHPAQTSTLDGTSMHIHTMDIHTPLHTTSIHTATQHTPSPYEPSIILQMQKEQDREKRTIVTFQCDNLLPVLPEIASISQNTYT